jgi:2-polyprenyl-6-hydroxyphenyl methylase / 3-demethylubiquinone-9 3-methyltransferase
MQREHSGTRLSDEELHAIYNQAYVDIYDPHAVHRIQRLLPLVELSSEARVADFGCGNGVLLELIASRVREYVGIDFSERHPTEYDVAFALDFSEHLYDDQFVRIFRAISGALKPCAPLYLHTPNAEYFLERLHAWGVLRPVEGHVGIRDARRHQELLLQSGFERVDVRHLAHYLPLAASLHGLGAWPLVGRHFRARLFLTCWTAETVPASANSARS